VSGTATHTDRLLVEQGYLVLRYVAEDVAKDLDGVLDALLRVVSRRQRSQPAP
jgi:very-short-patch-repair endonuclease